MRNNERDINEKKKYTMRQFFNQTIREHCVFQSLKNQKSHWFVYIEQLINSCVIRYDESEEASGSAVKGPLMNMVTEECHESVINHPSNMLKFSKVDVQKCVSE